MTLPFRSLHRHLLALLIAGPFCVGANRAAAQEPTGTLLVRARRGDSTGIEGAFVRSGPVTGITDHQGVARLVLPATLREVVVSRAGYETRPFEITIVGNATQRVDIVLSPSSRRGDSAVVMSTRAAVRLGDEPTKIALLDPDALTEQAASHPADLTRLLTRGVMRRDQTLTGPLDANRIRLAGLRGQYTGLLIDGLPLLGGRPDGFALMHQSPLAFSQVEVITGASSALYGSSAPAGVINLITIRPDRDRARASFNQSSEKGADLAFWGARRQSPTLSASLYADFHQQRLVDSDDDGWGEFPRAVRFSIRPQLFIDRPSGSGLVATVGAASEDRTGGLLLSNTDPNPYREDRRTRHVDGGVTWHFPVGGRGNLTFRAAGAFQFTSHRFGVIREADNRATAMGEVTYSRQVNRAALVAGVAVQRETLRGDDLPAFDYTFNVPSIFAQVTHPVSSTIVVSAAGRCDAHNVYGTFCTPRVSALFRRSRAFTARLTAGASYFAPTALTEETETIGLHAATPTVLNAERIQTGSADAIWTRGRLELNATIAVSRITHPVRLKPLPGNPTGGYFLINLDGPTRVFAGEMRATLRGNTFVGSAFYGHLYGTERDPNGTGRRETDLTPRHSAGFDVSWRAPSPGGTVVRVQTIYTGAQSVWDNPNRTRTPGYTVAHAFISQRAGRARLYASGENMLDVKLRDYEAVQLAQLGIGGQRTASPWAPLRGRTLSLGALVEW
ncbi:MAG: TonB-dependent receptor [Gemmatimonadota bacterium]